MRINRNYKPWLLVPDDDNRPVLECALVERLDETRGRLIVANGFALGVFDVELDPDEPVGLVKASYLKYARSVDRSQPDRRGRVRKKFTYSIEISDEWVHMPDGSKHPQRQDMTYPSYTRIMPSLEAIRNTDLKMKIGLTPGLLDKIVRAMDWRSIVSLRFVGKAGPYIVTSGGGSLTAAQWAEPELPFALLMPAHVKDDPMPAVEAKNGHEREVVHAS